MHASAAQCMTIAVRTLPGLPSCCEHACGCITPALDQDAQPGREPQQRWEPCVP